MILGSCLFFQKTKEKKDSSNSDLEILASSSCENWGREDICCWTPSD